MEPVSIIGLASAAVQVIDFAGTVLIKLYRYYLDAKTAAASSAELRDEVGLVLSLLNAVTEKLDAGVPREQHVELDRAIQGVRGILEEIDSRVSLQTTKAFRKLEWPFKNIEISQR